MDMGLRMIYVCVTNRKIRASLSSAPQYVSDYHSIKYSPKSDPGTIARDIDWTHFLTAPRASLLSDRIISRRDIPGGHTLIAWHLPRILVLNDTRALTICFLLCSKPKALPITPRLHLLHRTPRGRRIAHGGWGRCHRTRVVPICLLHGVHVWRALALSLWTGTHEGLGGVAFC